MHRSSRSFPRIHSSLDQLFRLLVGTESSGGPAYAKAILSLSSTITDLSEIPNIDLIRLRLIQGFCLILNPFSMWNKNSAVMKVTEESEGYPYNFRTADDA